MRKGIVCKVWNISATSKKKNENAQLGDSIGYILNEEKTDVKHSSDESSEQFNEKQLNRECKYVENDIKTIDGAYIGSMNLKGTDIHEAVREMMDVKRFYGKMDGRAALHGIISLPEEESDPQNAGSLLQLCNDVLREVFPNHQAIFAVHANTENLHVHFIVNSVGLDGKKIHQPKGFIDNVLQPCINKYAGVYGFVKNERWEKKREGSDNTEKKRTFIENKVYLRDLIDEAIDETVAIEETIQYLKDKGITVNVGKHISLKTEEMKKAIRSYQLGANYSKDAITERLRIKKEAFEEIQVSDLSAGISGGEIYAPVKGIIKRYAQMSPDEKKETIKALKEGKNPWKYKQNTNWQIGNIADDLNMAYQVREYVKAYSNNGSVSDALENILSYKKKIAEEKRQLKENHKKYASVIKLYKEMQDIEQKAYLYEHEGKSDYRLEYERYRELTRKLKKTYGKDISEVAAFEDNYQERLLYCNAQIEELSKAYRDVKQYCSKNGIHIIGKENTPLHEVIGFDEGVQLETNGVFSVEEKYVVSRDNPNIMLRVVKSPEVNLNGKIVENTSISVVNEFGEILNQFDSNNDPKGFRSIIKNLETEYGFTNCKEFQGIERARDYVRTIQKTKKETGNETTKVKKVERNESYKTSYSFTTAINLMSVARKEGVFYIFNGDNPYMVAEIVTKQDGIMINIMDADGEMVESYNVPSFQDRNSDGFTSLWEIKDKYGFSDQIINADSLDEAKSIVTTIKGKQRENRQGNRSPVM